MGNIIDWLGRVLRQPAPVDAAAHPKLVEVVEHSSGAELVLSDGARIVIDVSPCWLTHALAWTGLPPDPNAKAAVFVDSRLFTEHEWNELARTVIDSADARNVLGQFPGLRHQLELSYEEAVRLPFRVYGGSSQYCIYLHHPLEPRRSEEPPSEMRPEGDWHRARFSQPGGHLFDIRVRPATGIAQIDHACIPGHFVEAGCEPVKLCPPNQD